MRNIFVQKRKCPCDGTPSLAVLVRYTHHFGDHYWMILGKNLGMTPPYIGIGRYTSIYGYYLNNHIWGTISGVNPTTRQLLIYLSTLKYLTIRSNLNPMCISDQYCNLFSGKQFNQTPKACMHFCYHKKRIEKKNFWKKNFFQKKKIFFFNFFFFSKKIFWKKKL